MSAANHTPLTTEVTLSVKNMHEYVESFGLYWEQAGLPRMAGRILSWLLICDPPHQTMHQLTEALQASKSSISTGTRMLIHMGIIERLSIPGQRRDHYRVVPDSWSHIMEEKAKKQFTELRRLSERGLALLEGASPRPPSTSRGNAGLLCLYGTGVSPDFGPLAGAPVNRRGPRAIAVHARRITHKGKRPPEALHTPAVASLFPSISPRRSLISGHCSSPNHCITTSWCRRTPASPFKAEGPCSKYGLMSDRCCCSHA